MPAEYSEPYLTSLPLPNRTDAPAGAPDAATSHPRDGDGYVGIRMTATPLPLLPSSPPPLLPPESLRATPRHISARHAGRRVPLMRRHQRAHRRRRRQLRRRRPQPQGLPVLGAPAAAAATVTSPWSRRPAPGMPRPLDPPRPARGPPEHSSADVSERASFLRGASRHVGVPSSQRSRRPLPPRHTTRYL